MHPHTVLQNQTWNIPRQWQRNQGSTVFLLTSKKRRLRRLFENQNNKDSLPKTHWRSSTSCGKFGDLTMTDHKVLNEGCESRDNHLYAVVVQDLATHYLLKYIDVTRSTHSDLDFMQENVFTITGMSIQANICQILQLTKIQTTTRPDHVWPEVWTEIKKAAQTGEKQEWENEQPSSTMRGLRGIYFLLIQTIENTQTFSETQEENGKYLWLPRCRVKDRQASRKRNRRLAMKRSLKQM